MIRIQPLGFPWKTQDPFLFCAHHADAYPAGDEKMGPVTSLEGRELGNDFVVKDGFRMYHGTVVPGFPSHPHRGFETVTIATEGLVDHADSLGGAGRFGDGDVQWMTAGKGVQHSEMFPLVNQDRENPLEIFQIWLNLPAASKMVEAHYKMLWSNEIPRIELSDDKGLKTVVRTVAGELSGKKIPAAPPASWAANPDNDVCIWTIQMDANAGFTLPQTAPGLTRSLYLYKGDFVELEDNRMESYHYAEIGTNDAITIQAGENLCYFLYLQGKPINEPVAQYGPFVMNSQQEIQEAFADYQSTEFGGWPWDQHDQVHERSKSRFARYADGTEEYPDA